MPYPISVPPITTGVDTPRTRATDPDTSHQAADRTAKTLSKVQGIVLDLYREEADFFGDGLTDSELTELYLSTGKFSEGWPVIRPESIRKRRSDITGHGFLRASDLTRPNKFGFQEVVWVLA